MPVSTHSRLKAAGCKGGVTTKYAETVSTHSRLKAAGFAKVPNAKALSSVSTHSRLKAAGPITTMCCVWSSSFNTQPPEGGWFFGATNGEVIRSFNTQPPEGGWIAAFCKIQT